MGVYLLIYGIQRPTKSLCHMVNVSQKYDFFLLRLFRKGRGGEGLLKASPVAKLSWKINLKERGGERETGRGNANLAPN